MVGKSIHRYDYFETNVLFYKRKSVHINDYNCTGDEFSMNHILHSIKKMLC